jgi:hypothetical protein
MARKRKPTEINLAIDFGRRVFHDDAASMYEGKDSVTGNRLLIFITEETFITTASLDIAKEIRKTCDKVNMASIEVSALCPVMDSGLTEMNQAFFMSVIPEGQPLAKQEYDSVDEVIDHMYKIIEVLSVVHSIGLTQHFCNLDSEWYVAPDNTIKLVFPGVRGLLKRVRSKTPQTFTPDIQSDVREVCRVFDQLLNQISSDRSSDEVSVIQKRISVFREELAHVPCSLSGCKDFLGTLSDILSGMQVSSFPTTTLGFDADREKQYSSGQPEEQEQTGYDTEAVSDSGAEEDIDLSAFKNDYSRPKGSEENVFSKVIREMDSAQAVSSSYSRPKVEVFDANPVEAKKDRTKKDTTKPFSEKRVSSRFSKFTEDIYGDAFVDNDSRDKSSGGILEEEGGVPPRNKLLVGIAIVLIVVIGVLATTIILRLISTSEDQREVPESLSVFDEKSSGISDVQKEVHESVRDQFEGGEQYGEASESDRSDVKSFEDLGEDALSDDPGIVASESRMDFSEGSKVEDHTHIDAAGESKGTESDTRSDSSFKTLSESDFLDARMFIENVPDPIPAKDVSQVISFLGSDDFELRIAAIKALGEKAPRDDMRTKIAIESMLNDEDVLVRGFAAFALVSYLGAEARPILEDQLEYERNEVVSDAIRRALGRIKGTGR